MEQIQRPALKGATVMSALDMNKIHFDKKHTVLTPAVLDAIPKDGGTQAPSTSVG